MIDLRVKRFAIFGLQGSGKTELAKFLLRPYNSYIIYDTHHEYKGFGKKKGQIVYKPSHAKTERCINEYNAVINKTVSTIRPTVFFTDEWNRFCPSKKPLCIGMARLNDDHRHWGVGFGGIARRPVQLHTDLVELCHYLFFFNLRGKNDRQYLNDIAQGLGDAVAELSDFSFIMVDQNRNFEVMAPIKMVEIK